MAELEREWSVRVTVACRPGITRDQAERAAVSIQRHAESLAAVSHCYERDVYDLEDEAGPGDE